MIVFLFDDLHHFEDHGNIAESAAIVVGVFPVCLDGQETCLGQREIAGGLTLTGEVKLLSFLVLVFDHGGIINAVKELRSSGASTKGCWFVAGSAGARYAV